MNAIAIVLFSLAIWVWFAGNTLGWWRCKRSFKTENLPFNYRIYFGPKSYFNWLLKREEHEVNPGV
jgi:hypothetical protein